VILPDFAQNIVDFIMVHQEWAVPLVFLLAFAESLAFISLLFPATVILWGVGAMIGISGITFWPIWLAAALGAGLGDTVSYWLGYHYHNQIARMWPLSRTPDLLPRAHRLFERWGIFAVFFGRFIGPLRAVVPLVAGTATMPLIPFQIANWLSATAWGAVTLAPGAFGADLVGQWLK
jgi:membrane protein DedA with SNARE-associated domain